MSTSRLSSGYLFHILIAEKGSENVRSKSLTGTLHITLGEARELEHAPLRSRSRSAAKAGIETYVVIKVDGTHRTRSLISKTDRFHETFDIPVDKATEIEIAFYDKQPGEVHPTPIGLLWIRISDLIEALRKQRVVGGGQGGWVTANAMGGDTPSPHNADPFGASGSGMDAPLNFPDGGAGVQPSAPGQPSPCVESFFSVEPTGAVKLELNFSKSTLQSTGTHCAKETQPRKTSGSGPWKLSAVSVVRVLFESARKRFTR